MDSGPIPERSFIFGQIDYLSGFYLGIYMGLCNFANRPDAMFRRKKIKYGAITITTSE